MSPALMSGLLFGLALGGALGLLLPRLAGRRGTDPKQASTASETVNVADALEAERQRIYRDLHDDIGARLLQMVYAAPTLEFAEQARAALQDLRDVVSRTRRGAAPVWDVLLEIEAEARQRLGAAGIELDWQQSEDVPQIELEGERALHLYRIVREAISNALKHAGARTLRIRVKVLPRLLALELTDDGRGPPVSSRGASLGVDGMRQRAEQLHGAIRWTQGTAGGTKVMLSVPLARAG